MVNHLPRVLAILPGFTASTLMDVTKPLMALEAAGQIDFRVMLEPYTRHASIRWADLVVFCRNTEPRYQHLLDAVTALGRPYVYDLDDNLFEVPLDTDMGKYHRHPERLALLSRYLYQADWVRVYSPRLTERVQPLNSHLSEMTAPLDWSLIEASRRPPTDEHIKIVYVTSRQEDRLFKIFAPALMEILQRYPRQVEMTFWGYQPPDFASLPNVRSLDFLPNYDIFLRRFSRQGFDIGLAPLLDDEFHRSKTNNKFREYGACAIAGVYSNVDVYTRCVADHKTGLLVSNQPQAWVEALEELIRDVPLRRQIGQAAYAEVRGLYSQGAFIDAWRQQIGAVLAGGVHPKILSEMPVAPGDAAEMAPAGTVSEHWLRLKFQRAAQIFNAGGMAAIAKTIQLQLYNMWMLFKINRLNRL